MPSKTADSFTKDNYFKTEDLGKFDNNGYLEIVGRLKDLIISGGFNVYPKEIEDVIERFYVTNESLFKVQKQMKRDLDDAKNKKLADSILYAIRRDSSKFRSLVSKYSDDPGSISNGGVYSWFPKGQMTPEFEEFSFSKRVGRSGVVRTNYGFHVIQVLGRKIVTFK